MLGTQSEGTPLTHAEPAHHLVRLLGRCGHAVRNSIQPPEAAANGRLLCVDRVRHSRTLEMCHDKSTRHSKEVATSQPIFGRTTTKPLGGSRGRVIRLWWRNLAFQDHWDFAKYNHITKTKT